MEVATKQHPSLKAKGGKRVCQYFLWIIYVCIVFQFAVGIQTNTWSILPRFYHFTRQIRIPFFAQQVLGHSPQIGLLHGIKSKAAISLTFDLHCKEIAALLFIPYCSLIWGQCLLWNGILCYFCLVQLRIAAHCWMLCL